MLRRVISLEAISPTGCQGERCDRAATEARAQGIASHYGESRPASGPLKIAKYSQAQSLLRLGASANKLCASASGQTDKVKADLPPLNNHAFYY